MEIEQFIENIQKYSRAMGETPKSACDKSGAGYSMWDNLARGRMPSIDRVSKLAHYLGVTVSELLGETSVPVSDLDTIPPEVAAAYAAASPELQAAARRVLGMD